ncbi:hypothetical protein [Paraflavitalea pollutisoli]|uniref:hypothetical protein n=1 Tax=Paraflavitalea pollutisoli TaxID=3034143 RepID=UPI0023EB5C22|nr:hypothetical protein [Paraflavitalea sp. H1-2-19X]
MKKATLYLVLCCLFMACTKDEIVEIVPSPRDGLNFRIERVINDSTIELRWNPFPGKDFRKYMLVRQATYLNKGKMETISTPVDSSKDVTHTSFTETKMPFARDIYYSLYVYQDSMPRNPVWGSVYYQRLNTFLQATPTDVLIDLQRKWVYITESQKVHIVDYANSKVLLSKSFPSAIGYCSLGELNGAKEFYVPTADGWLQIHDAATLELKDRIYVAGYGIGSVAAKKGKLFVGSSEKSAGGYSNCIKVYDRVTKELVGRTGYWDRTRVVPLESNGNTIEMIDVTLNIIPVSLGYYSFNADGVPLEKREDDFHGDFRVDPSIVRSFPDGSRLITSSYGTVLNKSLGFDRYLKEYGSYSDFAFNETGSIIYAASATAKKIDVITYPGTTNTGNYPTSNYPYKIFRDGQSLVAVGKLTLNSQNTYLFIEKIDL